MRLERIFTHRLVRTLQLLLPILVIALVAIPTWNYFAKRSQKSGPSRQTRQLPAGVSVHTEGYTFSQTEGGKTSYTVRAKTYLGVKDEKSMLEDVEVTVFGATEKDPTRTIRGKHCTYDQTTNDFECNRAIDFSIERLVDGAHATLTKNLQDFVALPKNSAGRECRIVALKTRRRLADWSASESRRIRA